MKKSMIKLGEKRIRIADVFSYYKVVDYVVVEYMIFGELNKIRLNYSSFEESEKILNDIDILLLEDKIKIGSCRFKIDIISDYFIINSTSHDDAIYVNRIINNKIIQFAIGFKNKEDRDADLMKLDKLFVADPISESRRLKIVELNKN